MRQDFKVSDELTFLDYVNIINLLEDKKHIDPSDYNVQKVKTAISRAEALHLNKTDLCPKYFATTVYILLNKMLAMLPQSNKEENATARTF